MINRQKFYTEIRDTLFKSGFSVLQVDTIECILDEVEKQGVTDLRQIAYIFATGYKEAHNPRYPSKRLTPMVEYGGEKYLKSKKYYPYYGRGIAQITWDYNYRKEKDRLGIDLLTNPDLMLDVAIASESIVYNMRKGGFTGRKLSDYINDRKCDFRNARRIINGLDCADEVKGYAYKFYQALLSSNGL